VAYGIMVKQEKTNKVEREYIIPLRREWNKVPRYRRAEKAIKAIKQFLVQHMKIYDRDLDKIKVDKYVNEQVWHRGIRRPPAKIKIKAIKEDDVVRVELVDYPDKLKFKKSREEKVLREGEEKAKKKISEKKIEGKTEGEEAKKEEETEEKKAAVVEAGKEMEKIEAKVEKHTAKAKSPKQEKNQRVGYDKSGRGK
jgi:large subunit ribosomal protein L31e